MISQGLDMISQGLDMISQGLIFQEYPTTLQQLIM